MFSQMFIWGEKLLGAVIQFFGYFELTILEIFDLLEWTWLSSAIRWLNDFLGALPEFLTLFGDELLKFTFDTPLFDLIVLSIPAYLAYQLVVWILNIIT